MFYDEIDQQEQRPLSKRAFFGLVGALAFIACGYAAAVAMPEKEQQCVAAGGDPWHCAEQFGE